MIGARQAAFRSLLKCAESNKFANLEIDSAIKKYELEGAEKSLYTVLVYGTLERMITLDYYLAQCSNKPLNTLDASVITILRMTAYQVIFLDRIPNHAAVNEAVELAKKNATKGSQGFVNAVLRKLISCCKAIEMPADRVKALSIKFSIPEWIIELWTKCYGEEKTLDILEGIDSPPVITLRTNTLVNTRQELADKLRNAGVAYKLSSDSSSGIHIMQNISFARIEEICANGAYVQDEASQLAVEAVGCEAGDFVVDTCACPGGKSFGMAMQMENKGRLISLDLHKSKLTLVSKGALRLGIDIIEVAEHNSKNAIEEYLGMADRVLCDVPCSGLGVMAKKPETRYKDKESVIRLPEIQFDIVDASADYLKKGGRLVYSTCTLNKAENEDVVEKFISHHPEFSLNSMTTYFPKKGISDGFFVAVMTKN